MSLHSVTNYVLFFYFFFFSSFLLKEIRRGEATPATNKTGLKYRVLEFYQIIHYENDQIVPLKKKGMQRGGN